MEKLTVSRYIYGPSEWCLPYNAGDGETEVCREIADGCFMVEPINVNSTAICEGIVE